MRKNGNKTLFGALDGGSPMSILRNGHAPCHFHVDFKNVSRSMSNIRNTLFVISFSFILLH